MINLIVENMSTASAVDMNTTGKSKKRNVKPLVFQMIVFISSDMGKQSLNDGQGIWI